MSDLNIKLPKHFNLKEASWHLFPIRCKDRANLVRKLKSMDIETLIHYPIPVHKQKAYHSESSTVKLPICEKMSSELLSLPIGPHLDLGQVEFVIEALKNNVN